MISRCFLILFFMASLNVSAQWREDFSLLPFYDFAPWKGNFLHWTQDQGWLKSQGPAVSGTCISLQRDCSAGDSFELAFSVNLELATSSNNYLEMELKDTLSNSSLLVVVGGTADEVSVFSRKGGKDTLWIDGLDKRLSSSTSNKMAIRFRRLNHNYTLELGLQGDTSTWLLEGSAVKTSFYPQQVLIRACYSASNADKFKVDWIYFGSPRFDITAPQFLSVYDLDSQNWKLSFSEAMDSTVGAFYDANGDSAAYTWISASALRCRVPQGANPLLTAKGFRDRNGNRWNDTSLNLRYIPYHFRDIQITELMPDPSPPQGLPEIEWIELHNASDHARNLQDFVLSDLSASHLLPSFLLEPNAYLIITAMGNCALLSNYGNCLEVGFSSTFLNNSSDRLHLVNRQGDTLERLEYSDAWYQDLNKKNGGFSLEKKDPKNHCLIDNENFSASQALSGGSPGTLNANDQRIYDTSVPNIERFEVLTPSLINLLTTEPIDISRARLVFQQDTLALYEQGLKNYRITLSKPLVNNAKQIHEAILLGAMDCAGNSADIPVKFRYAIPEIPQRGELIFTEVLFKLNGGQASFIEVFNRGSAAQSLAGTKLFIDAKELVLGNKLLYPEESLILCKATDSGAFTGLAYMVVSGFPSLNANSGTLSLKNQNGEQLDYYQYYDTVFTDWPQKSGGYSIERKNHERKCSYREDWEPSSNLGGSPGIQTLKQSTIHEIQPKLQRIYTESERSLLVYFSGALSDNLPALEIDGAWGTMLRWDLADDNKRVWRLEWSDTLLPYTSYTLKLSGLEGCNGEFTDVQSIHFRLPGLNPQIRINEILYDPFADEPDYVELINVGSEPADLKGLQLGSLTVDGSIKEKSPIGESGFLLMPGAYVVLTEEGHQLSKRYVGYDESKVIVLAKLPSYPNGEGAAVLLDSLGLPLDSFRYDDAYHSQILVQTEGVSLERINASINGANGSNWTSASVNENFGTPGRKNSQSRGTPSEGSSHWRLYSTSFSPDGDGFEDVAILAYSEIEPNCLISIQVYSLSGVLVHHWANNVLGGTSGTFKWEGIDNTGQPIPDGPYAVLIEWTSASGQTKRERLGLVKARLISD